MTEASEASRMARRRAVGRRVCPAILDASDASVMQAEARDTEAIQLKFIAAIAEQFSVQIALGDRTFTQSFEV
ncbi:MAG: DUF1822 family protein, partial [Cyanobacteria bacterium J06636_16]